MDAIITPAGDGTVVNPVAGSRHELSSSTIAGRRALVSLTVAAAMMYVIAAAVTRATFQGDSVDYVVAVKQFLISGDARTMWEFGHIAWCPVLTLATYVMSPLLGGSVFRDAVRIALALNLLAGFGCVILQLAILRRFSIRPWVVAISTAAFISSHAFLNYIHGGTAYIPGLFFLMLGFWLLLPGEASVRRVMLAGASLGIAVAFWAVYLWPVAAILVMPLIFCPARLRTGVMHVLIAGAMFAAVCTVLFLIAAHNAGVRDVADLRLWIAAASHGINTAGLARTGFGFARSFLNLGNDGPLFKRYLQHDPFNPVSLIALFNASLWKLLTFYAAVGCLFLAPVRGRSFLQARLALLCISAPVLLFAIHWQGGDIERYFGLYPVFFLSAAMLMNSGAKKLYKAALLFFMVAATVTNLVALSATRSDRELGPLKAQVVSMQGTFAEGTLVVVHPDSQFAAMVRLTAMEMDNYRLPYYEIFRVNNDNVLGWQERFAENILAAWAKDKKVWVSECLVMQRPALRCNWVEGTDPRIRWVDINRVMRDLEFGSHIGGGEGFMVLPPSEHNLQFLRYLAFRRNGVSEAATEQNHPQIKERNGNGEQPN